VVLMAKLKLAHPYTREIALTNVKEDGMWSETAEGRKVIQGISRDIVDQFAPEELELFDDLVQEYFQDPRPPDSSSEPKDDPLGFGLSETLIAVTPAAMAMVSGVLNYLTTDIVKVAQEEITEAVKEKIKALFNSSKENSDQKLKNEIPPLTIEQLEQVKKLARKQAIQFGIKPEQAEKMSNALIGLLALK